MSGPTPLPVTATVVSYRGREDLRACLRSLLDQEAPPAEIVVVDNASDDGTPEMVRSDFPGVRFVDLGANLGPCAARNRGLREARHPLVLQVDQDVVLRPDCLRRLYEEWLREGDLAVLFPRALVAGEEDLVHYDGGRFHYAGVMALRHFYRRRGECGEEPEDVDAFISLAALVDRDAVLEVGGYDPAFFILFEDHDLSYRLRLCGRRIRSLPGAVVLHRGGTEGISFRGGARYPPRRLYLHSRNRWLLVVKNYRFRTQLVALPGVLLLGVAYVVFAWRQGALSDYVRAKTSLLSLWRHVLAERRRLAKLRRLPDRVLLGAPDLTFSPRIERGASGGVAERALSGMLRFWWRIVRPLAG